jgi:hypothetical protein
VKLTGGEYIAFREEGYQHHVFLSCCNIRSLLRGIEARSRCAFSVVDAQVVRTHQAESPENSKSPQTSEEHCFALESGP